MDMEPKSEVDPVTRDIEKGSADTKFADAVPVEGETIEGETAVVPSFWSGAWKYVQNSGVELRGIEPVPEELRTDTAFNKLFSFWCTSLLCPLP
jgi:hypothetical protein